MQVRRWIWLASALFAAMLAACAGGSGSSGFDISPDAENLAIARALSQGECVEAIPSICPADAGSLTTPPGSPIPPSDTVEVDVRLGETDTATCAPVGSGDTCAIPLSFTSMGFAADAIFRVAVRSTSPAGDWQISSEPVPLGTESAPAFGTSVEVPSDSSAVQLAVLVFFDPERAFTGAVETLSQSGADFAFVTPELPLVVR